MTSFRSLHSRIRFVTTTAAFAAALFAATAARAQTTAGTETRAENVVDAIDGEVGVSHVNPRTPPSGTGVMLGAGAGLRFGIWRFGARVRVHPQTNFTVYQVLGEAGLHPFRGRWDPSITIHGGYVSVAATHTADPNVSPHGLDIGLSMRGDYYVSPLFSLGTDATVDVLLFSRSLGGATTASETSGTVENAPGYALIGSIHAGLHFDL